MGWMRRIERCWQPQQECCRKCWKVGDGGIVLARGYEILLGGAGLAGIRWRPQWACCRKCWKVGCWKGSAVPTVAFRPHASAAAAHKWRPCYSLRSGVGSGPAVAVGRRQCFAELCQVGSWLLVGPL